MIMMNWTVSYVIIQVFKMSNMLDFPNSPFAKFLQTTIYSRIDAINCTNQYCLIIKYLAWFFRIASPPQGMYVFYFKILHYLVRVWCIWIILLEYLIIDNRLQSMRIFSIIKLHSGWIHLRNDLVLNRY